MISKVSNNFGIGNSSQAFRAVDPTTTTATDAQAPTTTPTSEDDSFSSTTTPTPTELAPKKSGGVNWLGVAAATGVTGLAIIGGHRLGYESALGSVGKGLKEHFPDLTDGFELNSVDEVVELLGKENKRAREAVGTVEDLTTELNNTRIDLESKLQEAQNALDNMTNDMTNDMTIEKNDRTREVTRLNQDVTRLNQEVTALKQKINDLQNPKGVKPEVPQSEAPKPPPSSAEIPDLSKISSHTFNGEAFHEGYNVGTFMDDKGICVYRTGFNGMKHVWFDTGKKSDQGYKIYNYRDKVVTNPPSVDPNLSVTPVAVVGQNPVAEVVVPQKKGFIEQAKELFGIGNPDDLGIEVGRKAVNLELPSSHTFNKKPLGEGFELQTVDGVSSFVPKGSYGDVIIKIGQTNHGFPIYGFPEI